MKKLGMIGGIVLIGGSLCMGCASKGFVMQEVTKSRVEIASEQTKQLKDNIAKLEMDVSKRIASIEANYALKSAVESDAYNREQKIMKDIEKQLGDIRVTLKKLEDQRQEGLERLSHNLQSSIHILGKQLKEQKEGLERAMEELDKIITGESTPTPSPTPPASTPEGPK